MPEALDLNDFEFEIVSADDTRITLVVYSSDGQTKISLHDFVAILQGWIDQVVAADQERHSSGSPNH